MKQKSPFTSADLRGLTQLLTDSTIGITDLVEEMQTQITHPPFLPSTPIQHLITSIAGITNNNIRFITKLIGGGIDKTLSLLPQASPNFISSPEREAIIAAFNGVLGSYLEEKNNPLQITMQFRWQGTPLQLDADALKKRYSSQLKSKILLMVHGSCMNDLQWTRNDHNHGERLANAGGYTPVYLHYNSGRHISTNGQELQEQLEKLIENWPVPVEELVILAHSMGGLISRSAIHYGQEVQQKWVKLLKKIVFLGTPHHGAPLEKAGNYLDVLLAATPYVKPFTRLTKIRSAGVTDLRYGNLVDEDWEDMDRFELERDHRQRVRLPAPIEAYTVAALLGKSSAKIGDRLIGDGLVPLASALGQHKDADQQLSFLPEHIWIAYECNHLDLLSDLEIYDKIRAWIVEE